MTAPLPPLPLAAWRSTRDRLHRWARLAGAVRRQCCPPRKHWWHIGLLPTARGLTTGPFASAGGSAELELELRTGELRLTADDGSERRLPLAEDPAGAGRERLLAALGEVGIAAELPTFDGATAEGYDAAAAGDYLRALLAVAAAFRQLQAELPGETSPLQLWPHHFDLALSWFSGRAVPGKETAPADEREESITLGFSTGDDGEPEPYLYALAYPWPAGAESRPLPVGRWHRRGWSGGQLSWAKVVETADPAATLLAFARGAWKALMRAHGALATAAPRAR